jgi:hypothetical protein
MSNILTGSQEEKNVVLGEGLSDQKPDVLPFNSSIVHSPSTLSTNFLNGSMGQELADLIAAQNQDTIEVDVGDGIVIEAQFRDDYITGVIQMYEDNTIYLDTGWRWTEEDGLRTVSNTEETHLIKNIGVIRCQK